MVVVSLLSTSAASVAGAETPAEDIAATMSELAMSMSDPPSLGPRPPRMVIGDDIEIAPDGYVAVGSSWGEGGNGEHPTVGFAADGKSAWIAMDMAFRSLCGMPQCMNDPPTEVAHGTALFEFISSRWVPVVWDFARVLKSKEQAAARRSPPPPIERAIDPGAEIVARQFETTLADPAALAASVSDRKDVVMFGSDRKERITGGAAVRAQLLKWKLGYKLRDGVFAGLSTSKQVVWLVANVDAVKPGNKAATAYRLFAIYEHVGDAWRVVQLNFAIPHRAGGAG
jgi:hypothetical protein